MRRELPYLSCVSIHDARSPLPCGQLRQGSYRKQIAQDHVALIVSTCTKQGYTCS